jgi:hypothetical protein
MAKEALLRLGQKISPEKGLKETDCIATCVPCQHAPFSAYTRGGLARCYLYYGKGVPVGTAVLAWMYSAKA